MGAEATETKDFADTPGGWATRWAMELKAAKKASEKWQEDGAKVVKRYLDDRERKSADDTRWNYFHSGVQMRMAVLYGQVPKVTVGRRFQDADDDVARVAGEQFERLLNTDIEREDDGYSDALQYALEDRLLPGIGFARVRYVARMETVPEVPPRLSPEGVELAPAVPATERKASEDVETDYVNWRDVLWSPCRVWHEARWVGFKSEMSREELIARFQDAGKLVPLNAKRTGDSEDQKKADPWGRAEVWELWSKEHKRVFWYVEGHPVTLDDKPDPLGLAAFFPCPRPMIANPTTSGFVPRSDYALARDLYNEIDDVSSRITQLERAIAVRGIYDGTAKEVGSLLNQAMPNQLIPVTNWPAFAEKGGLRGAIDWLPLEQITGALTVLRDYRSELVEALYQLTGDSDIMRGQAQTAGASATEQAIKAKFGSVRMQRLQDEFARFASDLQRLKAEIIAKHFEPQTILERCNCERTADKDLAMQAVQLLKSGLSQYRIEVKPEAVSLTDFAALKQERTEVIASIAQFMTSAAPMAAQSPASTPYLLEMLKWMVSGLRGASQIEGVMDRAIQAAQQAAAQPQQQAAPDPKLIAMQMKGQQDIAKVNAELQADVVRAQVDTQAENAKQEAQMHFNVEEQRRRNLVDRFTKPQQPQAPRNGRRPT